MISPIHQAHDKLFKLSLQDIRIATEFFTTHLPQDVLQQINLDTLKLENVSFIDAAFKSTEADIVYSVKQGNATTYFYLLCEQQTQVDKMMAFRLLVAKGRLMDLHYKQNQTKVLPLVYPMVLYTGERTWNAPLDIIELLPEPHDFARDVFFRPYQLIDLQRIPDETLQKNHWIGLIEYALKYRKRREITEEFARTFLPWLEDLGIELGIEPFRIVLNYIIDDINYNMVIFEKQITQYISVKELRGEAMTLAQQYEQRGIQKATHEVAKRLLDANQDIAFVAQITGLSVAEIQALQNNSPA